MRAYPLILGLDIASVTGWALWDTGRNRSSIECGTIDSPEKTTDEHVAAEFAGKLAALIRHCEDRYGRKPDLAVVEEMVKRTLRSAKTETVLGMLHGSAYATLSSLGVMWGTLPVATWRAGFYSKGYRPPIKVIRHKKPTKFGKMESYTDDWKAAAIAASEEMGISLPPQKKRSEDAAEAVALAICWKSVKLHDKRFRVPLLDLLQGRIAA